MTNNKPFAEIIESSIQQWKAQSWQWDHFPAFGSLVIIEQKRCLIFGIVYQVETGSMDPIRYPFPYQKTEEELLREQPQIFEFLRTIFSCITIGYQEKGTISYILAPEPPKIHAFVQTPSSDLAKQFFSSEQYIHCLFSLSSLVFNIDELLLALLKQQAALNALSEAKLERIMHRYTLLTGNDYRRLKLFAQRAEHLLE